MIDEKIISKVLTKSSPDILEKSDNPSTEKV